MKEEVDPSLAVTDLDALTLVSWNVSGAPEDGDVKVSLLFGGGLGRVTAPDGAPVLLDPIGEVRIERWLPGITLDELDVFQNLLGKWGETGMFLRVLEFEDSVLVVEDGENYLRLPQD